MTSSWTTDGPNAFLIGAPKCGTTSLAAYLSDHPDIYVCPGKEPGYFGSEVTAMDPRGAQLTSPQDYLELFRHGRGHKIRIDASTNYVWSRDAISQIESIIDGARYVVMVREPANLVRSLYLEYRFSLEEDASTLGEAWDRVDERRAGRSVPPGCADPPKLDYRRIASVGTQLQQLYAVVPRDRVLVMTLGMLRQSPQDCYLRTLAFLGLPDDGRRHFPVVNAAKVHRFPAVSQLLWNAPEPIASALEASKQALHKLGIKGLRSGLIRRFTRPMTRAERGSATDLQHVVSALEEERQLLLAQVDTPLD